MEARSMAKQTSPQQGRGYTGSEKQEEHSTRGGRNAQRHPELSTPKE